MYNVIKDKQYLIVKGAEIMYYEINVALNGKHFFATNERSVTNKTKLNEIYNVFREKFPPEEGYGITVSFIETIGKSVDMEKEGL